MGEVSTLYKNFKAKTKEYQEVQTRIVEMQERVPGLREEMKRVIAQLQAARESGSRQRVQDAEVEHGKFGEKMDAFKTEWQTVNQELTKAKAALVPVTRTLSKAITEKLGKPIWNPAKKAKYKKIGEKLNAFIATL